MSQAVMGGMQRLPCQQLFVDRARMRHEISCPVGRNAVCLRRSCRITMVSVLSVRRCDSTSVRPRLIRRPEDCSAPSSSV